jgi:hypothetical protein
LHPFLRLTSKERNFDFHQRRDRHRVVPPSARHPDLWGDRRWNIAVLPPCFEFRSTGFGRDHLFHLQEIFRMNQLDYIIEALDIVSARNVPDEDLADAISEQTRLMAGVDHDEYLDTLIDIIN